MSEFWLGFVVACSIFYFLQGVAYAIKQWMAVPPEEHDPDMVGTEAFVLFLATIGWPIYRFFDWRDARRKPARTTA